MRPARCLVLALLFCGAVAGISPTYAQTSVGPALYEALSQNNLLERRFEPLLRRVFGTLLNTIKFPLALRLNENYAEGSLNVYIVTAGYSVDKLRLPQGLVPEILQATRDNAVALSPDVLVFDAGFLADYIVNAWNLELAVEQGLAEQAARTQLGVPEEKASDPLAAFARLADAYRFGNIANRL